MSIPAIVWALKVAPVSDPTQALVLVALAETAKPDGTEARAAQATYANWARSSERTLRRHLRALEMAGLIRRGDQSLVAHLRPDRRPVVWDLALEVTSASDLRPDAGDRPDMDDRGDTGDPPYTPRPVVGDPSSTERPVTGGPSLAERPDTHGQNGRTLLSDKPSTEPSLKNEPSITVTPQLHPAAGGSPAPQSDEDFDAFWSAYPRKVAKPNGRKAWRAAMKRGDDPKLIIQRATAQADIWRTNGKTAPDQRQYIPHPATWLTGEYYHNEEPDRSGPNTQPARPTRQRTHEERGIF